MGEFLRRYRETRGGTLSPLPELLAFARAHRDPTTADLDALARRLQLPVAAVRGALSFYAHLRGGEATLRACRGTSCVLAGADGASASADIHPVYCLGYCDRSPAILRGADQMITGSAARALLTDPGSAAAPAEPPAMPSIRCMARRPIVTRRLLRGDFSALDRARADGAYRVLGEALRGRPLNVLEAMEASGERGRGGAGFKTGVKWRACAEAPTPDLKYVVANGDEGDPGSFIDRLLLEQDPHAILEGLALCALAVGAAKGIVFIRSEYPRALAVMERAVAEARDAGILGPSMLGSGVAFDVAVLPGMGSYVCGEETALLHAIEGLRGEVRLKPPYPATHGLFGRPTVVNNVETLANVPAVLAMGAAAFRALGVPDCPGTKALCLNHGFARPGVVEVEFGTTLGQVLAEAGGGADGRPIEAVLLGGPMGSVIAPDRFDVPLAYGPPAPPEVQLGHGGIVALLDGFDARALLLHWLTFMRDESCGRCVPCRIGSQEALSRADAGLSRESSPAFHDLLAVMADASLCPFGQEIPRAVHQFLALFGERIVRDA